MSEFLYATSHLAGDFTNPGNAVGNTPGTWAGALNENTNRTSRWALGDPVDPLTPSVSQTVRVTARKGSNSGTPTVALNLYENGTLIGSILGATNVTSTTGQTLTATFASSAVSDRTAVEIEVVMSAAGGNPSTRNSAQIARIEWDADTTPASGEHGTSAGGTGLALGIAATARKRARTTGALELDLGAMYAAVKRVPGVALEAAGTLGVQLGISAASAKRGHTHVMSSMSRGVP